MAKIVIAKYKTI
jgi:hypothetical protein